MRSPRNPVRDRAFGLAIPRGGFEPREPVK